MNHSRLDQLSDGIFAIVMTVLVFEFRIPDFFPVNNQTLWTELKHLLPILISYILSFALLFTYWRAHHFFISIYAKTIDSVLVNINGIFFMLIGLIPFSASILGQYGGNELSVIIFAVHIILIGLTLYWMRRYVLYSEHIKNPEISKRELRGSVVRTLVPVFFSMLAIPIAFWSINLSLTMFTLAVIFNLSTMSTNIYVFVLKNLHRFFIGPDKKGHFAD